ncbi:hypothetical protein PVAP13_4NG320750 [Panicum virgatum]|uniref:Uncharacterized protein n=1 Tax=Panicum virgatum TaxID=38727 RepID=A0A8T0TH39_PANVG|nr:hypothetical protein PVAP13_4NG320750 [Panicum virgatum]
MRPLPNSLRRRGGAPVALLGNAELRRAMVGPARPCGHRRGRPRARLRNGGASMASGAAGPPSLPRFAAAASPARARAGRAQRRGAARGAAAARRTQEGGGRKSSRRRPFTPSSAGGSSPGRPPRRGGRGRGRRRARGMAACGGPRR